MLLHPMIYKIPMLLLIVILLSSCHGRQPCDTSEVLSEMLSSADRLPAGRCYTTKSSPGAADYLSENLLTALYGTDGLPAAVRRAESISLWASSGLYACEFAVFRCSNSGDAEEIADLCLLRIDIMRHFISTNSERLSIDIEAKSSLDEARVVIMGRYVIMAVAPNADKAISAAREVIG